MKVKSSKVIIIVLLTTLLSTTLLPTVSFAKEAPLNTSLNKSTNTITTTTDSVLDEIESAAADQEIPPSSENSHTLDPTQYTDEDIQSLTWNQLTSDTVIQIHNIYDRSLLKLTAFFYSDLLQLLTEEEQDEVKSFSDDKVIADFDALSPDKKTLLNTYTPNVQQKINEIKELREEMNVQDTTPLPPVQYTEKEQEFRFARSKTEQSIDEIYRAANIVEQDLYLEGKHGLDLNLQRRYHSMESKISAPGWNEDEKRNIPRRADDNFATGWSFNTPRLEIVAQEKVASVKDDPKNSSLQIYSTKIETAPNFTRYFIQLDDGTSLEYQYNRFVNYPYGDAKFSIDEGNNLYTLYYRNLKYVFHFNTVTKSNIYGDTITYNLRGDGTPSSIEDSVGRYVELQYKPNDPKQQDLYVYKDKSKSVELKHIRYNLENSAGVRTYSRLTSVEEVPVSGSGGKAVTVSRYNYHNPSTKGIAYFNLNQNYTLDKNVTDQTLQESAKYWEADKKDRSEINYLLLQDAFYPLQGLKISYDYRPYNLNPDPSQSPFKDGLVRLFQDKYSLSYISYHPVDKVTYSYTMKTPQGSSSYKLEKNYADNNEFREVWKVPKDQLPRLANIAGRHGDIITVNESDPSRYMKTKTYKVNKDGAPLLKSVKTTGFSKGGTNFSGSKYQLSYNPTTYTSYAYSGSNTKPAYAYSFLEPTSAVSDTSIYTNYLKDPDLSKRSTYASKINDFAQETYFEYNEYGQPIKQIDPDGVVTSWVYDNGRKGNFLVYSQLNSMKKQATTSDDDPYYHLEIYDYNANYLVKKETIIDAYPVNPTSYKNQTIERTYEYNNNQLYSINENFGSGLTRAQTFTQYDMYGLKPTQISLSNIELESGRPQVLTFQLEYDAKSQLKSQTYPDGSKVTYDYDDVGREKTESFRNQGSTRTLTYSYKDGDATADKTDGPGIVEKTLPDSTKLVTYYTPYGDIAYQEQIGTNGSKRTLFANEFTADGLQITRTTPYGISAKSTAYSYDWDGFLYQQTNAIGTTKYSRTNAFTEGSKYLPREAGQIESPNGYIVTTYKDLYGRVESTEEDTKKGNQHRVTTYQTDRFGKVTNKQVTDGSRTQSWIMRYDNNGSLVYMRDPENNVYDYLYDGLGNLIKTTENGVATATYTYNVLSWKLSEKNPETKAETYSYANNGTLKTFKDKNGISFTYNYTPFYEMTKLTAGNGYYEEHVFDPASGKLLNENSTYGNAISYGYDAFQRNNRQTMMDKDYQLIYEDADDQIDALIYPSRSTVTNGTAPSLRVNYTYDSANRLESVSIPGVGTTTYGYTIGSSGETDTVSYPGQSNALQQTISSFGELTKTTHADAWSETNGYDLFGNIINQKRPNQEGTFAYDNLSRIKEEVVQGKKKQYAYDQRGNRQIYANATGNVVRSYELKHDVMNRLSEYKDDNGRTTYTYYPNGLRASKQQIGTVTDTTKYVYINGQVVEELTQDGRVKARNVFGNKLIWRKDYSTNQEGNYYYNSHGDVVKIKDAIGNILNTYDYDIWGNLLTVSEKMSNPFTYAGEVYDKESGFYYLRARYYDPGLGRFISEDTYKGQVDNPLSLNRYAYVSNNPLKYVDPSGHQNEIGGSSQWNRDLANNWVINDAKNRWALAQTEGERNYWGNYAEDIRTQMYQAGYSKSDVMQSTDAMILDAHVMKMAKESAPGLAFIDDFSKAVWEYPGEAAAVKGAFFVGSIFNKGNRFNNIREGLNFASTAAIHMGEAGRFIPVGIQQAVIKYGKGLPDPRGSNATMFYDVMYKNGKKYNIEVLYEAETNTVFHFKYTDREIRNGDFVLPATK